MVVVVVVVGERKLNRIHHQETNWLAMRRGGGNERRAREKVKRMRESGVMCGMRFTCGSFSPHLL